jgi:uncharacterized protein YbjT (DUF2867 family)
MHILLTGANGYIGKRLLPVLLHKGYKVTATVRNASRISITHPNLQILEIDFLQPEEHKNFPEDIDVAYYLIHSMGSTTRDFPEKENAAAWYFVKLINHTNTRQIIYLSGISNANKLSKHLQSRKDVETVLSAANSHLTILRAGIIIGSGSASFEILRDLVEKLPVMVAPRWLNSKIQPIAIKNVIDYLTKAIANPKTYDLAYDIGGPEILTYKQMLLKYARVRKLKRLIKIIPVMTPRLSSYWLYFITSTSYNLAVNLVNSMKVDVVCGENNLSNIINIELLTYEQAIQNAFQRTEQNMVLSSWKDAFIAGNIKPDLSEFIEIPNYGCYKDIREVKIKGKVKQVKENLWNIGGERGWYYANWLWKFRGFWDKMLGGVGLRRGRTNADKMKSGDVLDFWRVIYASEKKDRLILYAEMKLPGEAWLEFRIIEKDDDNQLLQTATFRPKGLWGRLYWIFLSPFHWFIFRKMAINIEKFNNR